MFNREATKKFYFNGNAIKETPPPVLVEIFFFHLPFSRAITFGISNEELPEEVVDVVGGVVPDVPDDVPGMGCIKFPTT